MTIILPHPPKACSPNGRFHRQQVAAAKRTLRAWAKVAALHAFAGHAAPHWKRATCQLRVYYRRKTRADGDNWISRCKAVFDGLQDAGVIVNDAGFIHLPPEILVDRERPRVEVEVLEVQP